MKYILFLMFFITPPVPPETPKKDRVYTLQSTSVMEFASSAACAEVGAHITNSVATTTTMTVRGWCFCESTLPDKKCPMTSGPKAFSRSADDSVVIQKLAPPKSE